ncbi:hypothetical protein HDF16_005775 [Granulicella aggregans]|uniref:Uncharacterized protein n=1 Tax=Granulicella aggregans TaxID=474949 RepID=A0A7W8E752_9BACT|nr:hypothetical protein [Granulicella aggregans]
MSVLAACEQIALPMTGDGAVFNLRRPLADRNGIDDLTLGVPCCSSMYRATNESLGPKMLNQLLLRKRLIFPSGRIDICLSCVG